MIYENELFEVDAIGSNLNFSLKKNIHEFSEQNFVKLGIGASISYAILFEITKSQGTNIIINESNIAVIGRKTEDGFNIGWDPKSTNQNELQDTYQKILNALKPVENIITAPTKPTVAKQNVVYDENNYMVKHLKRQP